MSSVNVPPSPHFTPLDLSGAFNADRARLDGGLLPRTGAGVAPDWSLSEAFGERIFHGIPFALGERDRPNVVLLNGDPAADSVRIDLEPTRASYLVFLHAVEDVQEPALDGFGAIGPTPPAGRNAGNTLGGHVADYVLVYEDGREAATPILRRFAIQQRHISWGASPFAAIPALGPAVFTTGSDDYQLDRRAASTWGRGETRHDSLRGVDLENLWLYALPNPEPDTPIRALVLRGGAE